MDPKVRRLAVPTEDHPVEYLDFQGDIPNGNYGAGQHRIWDKGSYRLSAGGDAAEHFANGKLKFELDGKKLKGVFNLFRLGSRDQWLLVKGKDEHAVDGWLLKLLLPDKDGNDHIKEEKSERNSGKRRSSSSAENRSVEVVKTAARIEKGEKLSTIASVLKRANLKGDVRAKVGEFAIELTSLDRAYWPADGFTKADLLRYYFQISRYMLPYLKDRPLIMKRYPTGIKGISFHQHDVDSVPEFVETARLDAEDGGKHTVDYVVGGNLQTHLYLANLGAIERHPWHSRTGNLNCPDWFVFDLDPGEKVDFDQICEIALISKDVIEGYGLSSYAKTSGSRGIHVYVPVKPAYTFDLIAVLASKIAKDIAKKSGKAATVARSKSLRKPNQVYVDHLQNAYGKSVVAPYSVRPKPGATVSAPVAWKEIEGRSLTISSFTISNIFARVEKLGDLFRPVLQKPQSLEKALDAASIRVK